MRDNQKPSQVEVIIGNTPQGVGVISITPEPYQRQLFAYGAQEVLMEDTTERVRYRMFKDRAISHPKHGLIRVMLYERVSSP